MLNRVDHFVAMVDTLVVEIIKQGIDLGPIVRRQLGLVLVEMFEVSLLSHGRLIDMVIGSDAIIMSNLC